MHASETTRLTVLGEHETDRLAAVQEYTLQDERWVFATNGWLLAMIRSGEPAEPLRIPDVRKTIECKRELIGVVDAEALIAWAGPIEPDRWAFCEECHGRGKLPLAGTLYKCGECDGDGGYQFPFFNPGRIWDRIYSRQLLARGLWTIGASGSVELLFGEVKKAKGNHKLLWVQQEGRRLALMQMALTHGDFPSFEWAT